MLILRQFFYYMSIHSVKHTPTFGVQGATRSQVNFIFLLVPRHREALSTEAQQNKYLKDSYNIAQEA